MKKNKVIFFPDKNVYKFFLKEKKIIFFDENGWWIFNGKSRINISISRIDGKFKNFNILRLVDSLRFWGPLWARMIGTGDLQELLYRKSALLIHSIAIDLQKFNIGTAYFMTSITHHVDSLIFDIACSQSNINKIFMYREVIAGRLVPFIQKTNIPSRLFLNKTISNYKFNKALDDFIENKKRELPPKTNYEHERYENFMFALFVCFFKDLKFIAITIKYFIKPNTKTIFNFIYKTYPFQFTAQLIRARLALDFYIKNQIGIDDLISDQKQSEPALLISANFQPEATSFPEGWHFSNHIDLVIEIRKRGYSKKIYYKEHPDSYYYVIGKGPTCVGIFRNIDYYKQLLDLGCVLVPRDFNLSVNSKYGNYFLPVTISGTIGLERSLSGYHTITAGYPWYQNNLPGILDLKNIKSLKKLKNSWVAHSQIIADDAYQYMLKKLNDKTVINAAGIGDSPINKMFIKAYLSEFKRLINSS